MKTKSLLFALAFAGANLVQGADFNPAMQSYIDGLKREAKATNPNFSDFDYSRGEKLFATKSKGKNGEMISCQSCHNADLRTEARNIFTGKAISPLAPSANPSRLTDTKEVAKWLKRNFKDVFLREGTALEKGDVLYYLIKQ